MATGLTYGLHGYGIRLGGEWKGGENCIWIKSEALRRIMDMLSSTWYGIVEAENKQRTRCTMQARAVACKMLIFGVFSLKATVRRLIFLHLNTVTYLGCEKAKGEVR
jgi:hypothetical protein